MKIKILYEDPNILAIDKPSGLIVHSDGKTKEDSVVSWFIKKYPRAKNVGEKEGGVIRPGIVHRLDRETSGVLLLAKNQKAHEFLKKQFMDRGIKKTYIAIVSGDMKEDRGVINKPIGRSPKDFRRYLAGRGARGEMKEAITQYRVLKRFKAENYEISSRSSLSRVRDGSHTDKKFHNVLADKTPHLENFSASSLKGSHADKNFQGVATFTLLEIHPKTGRTHQIRVHMKYKNHPVVCDHLYDPEGFCPKNIGRLALHAKSIEFKNLKGEVVKVESSIPKEFA